jgi:hypothetical protein
MQTQIEFRPQNNKSSDAPKHSFRFVHPVLSRPDVYFSHDPWDPEPSLNEKTGASILKIPISRVAGALGIPPHSRDRAFLTLVPLALAFRPTIRHGDTIPDDVLGGGPDPHPDAEEIQAAARMIDAPPWSPECLEAGSILALRSRSCAAMIDASTISGRWSTKVATEWDRDRLSRAADVLRIATAALDVSIKDTLRPMPPDRAVEAFRNERYKIHRKLAIWMPAVQSWTSVRTVKAAIDAAMDTHMRIGRDILGLDTTARLDAYSHLGKISGLRRLQHALD